MSQTGIYVRPLRALYYTLGCKLNFSETSTIEDMLSERGILPVKKGETPDIVVINTCSVTGEAGKKSIRAIRSYHRKYPEAAIVVTGCHAQLNPDELRNLNGVKVLVGNDRKQMAVDYIMRWVESGEISADSIAGKDFRRFEPSCSRGERTRFFLKVQDGCDYWCSYCTIPRARGRSRSPLIADLVAQAQYAASQGGREIVLTGVNIGDFGKNTGEAFLDLVKALDRVEGIDRYRISSIEPNLLTEEIIAYTAESPKFMPHFHVPLQSGSDEVLRLMRRHYDTAMFREKMELIMKYMPDAFIGIDLIVGARGESERYFDQSAQFVSSLPISRLHIFTYSERADTAALDIPLVVNQEERHRRMQYMTEISRGLLDKYLARFKGTRREVLVEHPCSGRPLGGFTDNYIRVNLTNRLDEERKRQLDNRLVMVELGDYDVVKETMDATLVE